MKPIVATAIVIGAIVGIFWLSSDLEPMSVSDDSPLISETGIHWHPELVIYVDDVAQEIPANIGIGTNYASMPTYHSGMRMTAIHTHADLPVIHLEFPGRVTEENLKLGNFFRIWGKEFMSFGSSVAMKVNGLENTDLENYIMKDKDKIELRYSSQ